jgi:hypothetical protein
MEQRQLLKDAWFSPWTRQTVLWVALAFAVMVILEFPFVFFFDTMLTHIGFLYVYMWALPQALILYFVAFSLKARWTSTVLVGLMGIIGAPVDYYFEWVVQQNLLSPVYAFLYIPLYFLAGFSADVCLMLLHPGERPLRAALISSCIFTAVVLFTTILATFLFYPAPKTLQGTWLGYGGFLVPYSLIAGTIGGYVGFSIARDMNRKTRI